MLDFILNKMGKQGRVSSRRVTQTDVVKGSPTLNGEWTRGQKWKSENTTEQRMEISCGE